MTRTQIHHKETGFTGANADISPSRGAGSSCESWGSGQLGAGTQLDLSGCLERGSHRDRPLWSSRSVICAPLSTFPPDHVHPCPDGPLASHPWSATEGTRGMSFGFGHEIPPSKKDTAEGGWQKAGTSTTGAEVKSKEVLEANAGVGNKRGRTAVLGGQGWVGSITSAEKHMLPVPFPHMERWGTSTHPHPHPGDAPQGKQQDVDGRSVILHT